MNFVVIIVLTGIDNVDLCIDKINI